MNVLLIYPKIPETFWSFTYALRFIGKKAAFPPLGLLTVAALLPEGFRKRLVDANVQALTDEDIEWADIAFIGGMTIQRDSAKQLISRCRGRGLKVVGGGPLFTSEPEAFAGVDHLVLDEAECTLPAFLEDLESGCPKEVYRAPDFCDLTRTPVPAWELIDMKKYASMSLQFSRGCPFNCDFCNVTALFGRRTRMKTPGQILAELDCFFEAGWRGSIFFVDDNFIGNRQYLKNELLPALIEWRRNKKGYTFFTEASINLADDPELLDLMVRAGFDSVFVGIESPDEACLTECRKTQNKNRDLLQNVKTLHRAGLQVMGGFIVGFDSDTPSIFQRQIDFIQKSGIVTAMVGILQAAPGTRLFERLNKEHRLVQGFSGDNVNGSTNIIPKMGREILTEGYQAIMKKIYSPKYFYRRVRNFMRDLEAPKISVPMDTRRLLAVFRSVFRLGILGKERFQYWHLLAWTLLRKPRQLPLAVTLAIYGYHFRRICDLHIQ